MGFLKNIGKAIVKPFKKSKVLRVVASAASGATVGFFLGGPPGAWAGGIYSAGKSLEHNCALVVGVTVELGPKPKPKREKSQESPTTEPVPVHYSSAAEEEEAAVEELLCDKLSELYLSEPPPELVQLTSEQLDLLTNALEANNPKTFLDRLEEFLKNAKEKKTFTWKALEFLGSVLKKGEDWQTFEDDIVCGPRYEISENDPPDMALLKTRANNLVHIIEQKCGNYDSTHRPPDDITNGFELCRVVKEIERIEQKIREGPKFVTCVSCQGSGFVTTEYRGGIGCQHHSHSGEPMDGIYYLPIQQCPDCSQAPGGFERHTFPCTICGGKGTVALW